MNHRGHRGHREADAEINALTECIIGAGIDVHRELGPGLLEGAYEACMCFELARRGLGFERQKPLPVPYKGLLIECGYRLDLLVEGRVAVELKAVDALGSIHQAQLLTYLKLSRLRVGLLLNFNVEWLRDGVKRLMNDAPR